MGPAVVPGAGLGAAGDRDRVSRHLHLVIELRVSRPHVDAAMAHVDEALLPDRPVGIVQVVAGPGESHRPRHLDPVAGTLHQDRVALLDRQVRSVRCVLTRPPGADRPSREQLAVPVQLHVVLGRARNDDQRPADAELLGERVHPVKARRGLHAIEMAHEADRGVGGPVITRAEGEGLAVIPVPGADHGLGRGDRQRPLDGCPVLDGLAEGQHDRHPHAVLLLIALEDMGGEGLRWIERLESAGLRDLVPARAGCHCVDRQGLRHR